MSDVNDEVWEARHTKRIAQEPTEQEQQEFHHWKIKYEALEQEGIDRGWLVYNPDGGYDMGHPVPAGYDERPETDEELQKRLNDPWGKQTWQLLRRMLEQVVVDSEKMAALLKAEPSSDGLVHLPIVTKRPEE